MCGRPRFMRVCNRDVVLVLLDAHRRSANYCRAYALLHEIFCIVPEFIEPEARGTLM